jgi:hypothetical protein
MNKLHKFNEHWADDELADTNRRLADLDDEEGINNKAELDLMDEEEMGLRNEIFNALDNYKEKYGKEELAAILDSIVL